MEIKKIASVVGIIFCGIIAIFLMVRFIYGGPEDTWICNGSEWIKHGNPRDPKPDRECGEIKKEEKTSPTTSIANPASVFCLDHNGSLAFKADTDGNQYAVCILEDGKECEEWEFYRTKKCGDSVIPQGGEVENSPIY
jgi:putative hemolysin